MQELSRRHSQPPAAIAEPQPEYVYDLASEAHPIRHYWKLLVKRRVLIMLVFLGVVAIGAIYTFRATPLYTANATLKIETQSPSVTGMVDMLSSPAGDPGPYDFYQTQFALLASRPLAARVIRQEGLQSNPVFTGANSEKAGLIEDLRSWCLEQGWAALMYIADLVGVKVADVGVTTTQADTPSSVAEGDEDLQRGLVDRYLGYLKVKPVRNTRLVQVAFSTPDPRLSQQLANVHATAFIHLNLATRFELTKEAREFLDRKLTELRAKVERAEDALNRFRQMHGVVSLERGENLVVERMMEVNRRLTEASTRRIELESLYRMIKNKNFQYLSQVINSGMIQQLKGRLDTLEAERARLSTLFTPDHPRVLELSQQIAEAQRRLNIEIGNVVRGVESDYAAARTKEEALQLESERQQKAALNLKGLGAEYTVLQGEVDASRSIYDGVLRRINETNVSKDTPLSNIQITESAELPLAPSSPQVRRNLLFASVLGLFLGVSLAFVLELLDSTVRTPDDVWRAVAVPTLGVVPHLNSLRSRIYGYNRLPVSSPLSRLSHPRVTESETFPLELMVAHHPLSLISEAYRTLRTVLLLTPAEKPPQVILLTSAHPGDGKTSTTLNLAITLAQAGRRVVVVDGDMRKGNSHRLLHLKNHPGLTDVVSGAVALEDSVQQTAVAGLSFIPRGPVPADPSHLLGSSAMKAVVETLRQRFDFVLIDTPPAIVVSDAAVLSVLCDGVLLVLRGQRTTSEAARRVIERLEGVGARILGAVLNAVDLGDPDYADYRSYYTSYYATAQADSE